MWCVCVYVHVWCVCMCMYGVCMHMFVVYVYVCVYTCVVCLGFIFLRIFWAYWVCGWMCSIIFEYSWPLALQTCFSASFSHFYFWDFHYTCVRIDTYQNIGTLLLHALVFKKSSFFSLCASAWIILIDLSQGSLISSLPVWSLLTSSWQACLVCYMFYWRARGRSAWCVICFTFSGSISIWLLHIISIFLQNFPFVHICCHTFPLKHLTY